MEDPYRILGVRPGASQQEIRQAYRELVKKYHPDRYADNPLRELAQEKLKQINQAYDTLTRSSGIDEGPAWERADDGREGTDFLRIRQLIASGSIAVALGLLEKSSDRTAEWYYLSGVCLLRQGYFAQASQHIQTAVAMEPNNIEYRRAMERMAGGGPVYRQRTATYHTGPDEEDLCRLCQCMICTDCCCECMGGRGLPCI